MFHINYDLAKLITEERRELARSRRRPIERDVTMPSARHEGTEADVIEIAFGSACEPDQVGA